MTQEREYRMWAGMVGKKIDTWPLKYRDDGEKCMAIFDTKKAAFKEYQKVAPVRVIIQEKDR